MLYLYCLKLYNYYVRKKKQSFSPVVKKKHIFLNYPYNPKIESCTDLYIFALFCTFLHFFAKLVFCVFVQQIL